MTNTHWASLCSGHSENDICIYFGLLNYHLLLHWNCVYFFRLFQRLNDSKYIIKMNSKNRSEIIRCIHLVCKKRKKVYNRVVFLCVQMKVIKREIIVNTQPQRTTYIDSDPLASHMQLLFEIKLIFFKSCFFPWHIFLEIFHFEIDSNCQGLWSRWLNVFSIKLAILMQNIFDYFI